MPKLHRLSGPDVVRILERFGFMIFSQRGSHIKLRRFTEGGEKQTLTMPNHKQLDTGTCKAIFRQASRFVAADELRQYLISDYVTNNLPICLANLAALQAFVTLVNGTHKNRQKSKHWSGRLTRWCINSTVSSRRRLRLLKEANDMKIILKNI